MTFPPNSKGVIWILALGLNAHMNFIDIIIFSFIFYECHLK